MAQNRNKKKPETWKIGRRKTKGQNHEKRT